MKDLCSTKIQKKTHWYLLLCCNSTTKIE